MADDQELLSNAWLQQVRERTPARLLVGRSGSSYRTSSQLELRAAHAAATDAVHHEFNLAQTLGDELCREFSIFEIQTQAGSKAEYLLRPDRGRVLNEKSKQAIADNCPTNPDIQLIVGDGLSVAAVSAQVPRLLPLLVRSAKQRNWSLGQSFACRYCRVGVLNEIGELIRPRVAVLLIGERPGLATAESLSAYLAYRPQTGHTDADRNLVSNIHARGTPPESAVQRICSYVDAMLRQQVSGTTLDLASIALHGAAPKI